MNALQGLPVRAQFAQPAAALRRPATCAGVASRLTRLEVSAGAPTSSERRVKRHLRIRKRVRNPAIIFVF